MGRERSRWRRIPSGIVIVASLLAPRLPSVLRAAELRGSPNVVVVLEDPWRAPAFGFAGDPKVRTPHLDRFARGGIRLVNVVAGLPVCSPTRASLLTDSVR